MDKAIEILSYEDTEDGGAIIEMEVDRELLIEIFSEWLNRVLMEHCEEILEKKNSINNE